MEILNKMLSRRE